jgi:hypothetical protein
MGRFKKKPTDKLPLSEYMDEENRVYYWQVSPESPLIQVKRDFKIEQILVPNDKFIEPTKEEVEIAVNNTLINLKLKNEYKELTDEEKIILAKNLVEEYIEQQKQTPIDITKPTYTPVPTDLKQQALSDINNYKNTLGVDVNKQFAYFIIGVIAIVILGIIVFYIAVNKGDLPILTK